MIRFLSMFIFHLKYQIHDFLSGVYGLKLTVIACENSQIFTDFYPVIQWLSFVAVYHIYSSFIVLYINQAISRLLLNILFVLWSLFCIYIDQAVSRLLLYIICYLRSIVCTYIRLLSRLLLYIIFVFCSLLCT